MNVKNSPLVSNCTFSLSSLKNLILRGGAYQMIYDITNSLEANPGAEFSKHECDVEKLEASRRQTGRENFVGDILCPAVKRC